MGNKYVEADVNVALSSALNTPHTIVDPVKIRDEGTAEHTDADEDKAEVNDNNKYGNGNLYNHGMGISDMITVVYMVHAIIANSRGRVSNMLYSL